MKTNQLITITDRGPEEVFSFISTPQRLAATLPAVTNIEPVEAQPVRVGTRLRESRSFLGREFTTDKLEVRRFDRPRVFSVGMRSLGVDVETIYRLEPVGSGTRIVLTSECRGSGLGALLAPITAWRVEAEDAAHLESLKETIEREVPARAEATLGV